MNVPFIAISLVLCQCFVFYCSFVNNGKENRFDSSGLTFVILLSYSDSL